MALKAYEVTVLKSKIEYIISTLSECPNLTLMKVQISSLEFKNDKYYISGNYECVTIVERRVVRKGSFSVVIDKDGRVYEARIE